MKHGISLIIVLASIGFMLGCVSCTGLPPAAQGKVDNASSGYTEKAGVTPAQTVGLLGKWWLDYEAARSANEILRTKAEPVTDWTSAKGVKENVQPQASVVPSERPERARERSEPSCDDEEDDGPNAGDPDPPLQLAGN